MAHHRTRLVCLLAVLTVMGAIPGAKVLSSTEWAARAASPSQSEEFKSDEYLILGSPNRGAGEPMVFVNPKDSNNIIVVAMATLNRLPTGETPLPRGRGAAGAPTAPARPAHHPLPTPPGRRCASKSSPRPTDHGRTLP